MKNLNLNEMELFGGNGDGNFWTGFCDGFSAGAGVIGVVAVIGGFATGGASVGVAAGIGAACYFTT